MTNEQILELANEAAISAHDGFQTFEHMPTAETACDFIREVRAMQASDVILGLTDNTEAEDARYEAAYAETELTDQDMILFGIVYRFRYAELVFNSAMSSLEVAK